MNNIEAQLYGAFAAMEKRQRGGARRGAGRKPGIGGKRAKLRICLTSDVAEFLARDGETLGTAVEASVRRSAAFKTWLKSRIPPAG